MTDVSAGMRTENERDTACARLLATMSSGTLLAAADALHAWGAENDSESIESWVARRLTRQQPT